VIPTPPALFADPETVAELSGARAVILLIGGYDGSGNYGDLVQLDAALGLLARFEPGLRILPVLERSRLADHRTLRDEFVHPPAHCLFFDPGEGHEGDLLPVAAPADLAFAACYLYGGGYLNRSWGARKLAMLAAAEALLGEGGAERVYRISSGLQTDAEWLSTLADDERARLRSFALLGARDSRSAEALAAIGAPASVLETGDDAVGLLRATAPAGAVSTDGGRLRLNLHIAEHAWVTGRPDSIADFCVAFAAELGRRAGLLVLAQPLIAYDDRHVSDRAAMARLAAARTPAGVELAEPRVLHPHSLATALGEMNRAALTLSCSYHVALTSLLLGVPTVLIGDNAYYEQKAAGLAEDFDLPQAFALRSDADPRAAAGAVAAVALDETAAAAMRSALTRAAERTRERRAEAEVELLSRLGGAAAVALGKEVEALRERLRQRSLEPAELLTQLSLLRSENGVPLVPEPRPAAAEGSAERKLTEITGSRSWRVTAPLRRIGARLRRGR
jgi:hypothetical protein